MTLSINSIVRWSAIIATLGLVRREFGKVLFLTTDYGYLNNGARRTFEGASTQDFTSVFPATYDGFEESEVRPAASIYFQQVPYPKNLIVGRWVNADIAARLEGTTGHATLAQLTPVTDGAVRVFNETFTGIDLSGATSLSAAATLLQTSLRTSTNADLTACDVEYDSFHRVFVVTSGRTGDDSTMEAFGVAPSGTDLGPLFKLTSSGLTASDAAPVVTQGQDAETIQEAMEAIVADSDPYFIVLDRTLNDTDAVTALSEWVESQDVEYQFAAESNAAAVLTTGEATSIFAQLFALQRERTFGTWSATADYKALSVAARFSSVNFSGTNTVITGKFKQLPGTTSDKINTNQKRELDRKRVNHYSPFSGDDIYAEGYSFKTGIWIDSRYFLDWFVNAIRTDQYNLLRTSGRVPQTEPGMAALQDVAEQVGTQGVTNGGIAPGQLSAAQTLDVQQTTGNLDFDGFLPRGFLFHYGPIVDQSQQDRVARLSTVGKAWLKGSGAIHFVDGTIIFED